MPDVFTKACRSQVMAVIRSRGNKGTELAMIWLFRRHYITGWRRGVPLFGRPDFVFRAHRLAVFVDGCFWHQCPRHCRMPAGNRDFWAAKLTANRRRDRLVTRTLQASAGGCCGCGNTSCPGGTRPACSADFAGQCRAMPRQSPALDPSPDLCNNPPPRTRDAV